MYSLRKILQNEYQSLTFVFLLPNLMFNHFVTSLSIRRFFLFFCYFNLLHSLEARAYLKGEQYPLNQYSYSCSVILLNSRIRLYWHGTLDFLLKYTRIVVLRKKERMQTLNMVVVTNMIRFLSLLLQLLYQIVNNENDQL